MSYLLGKKVRKIKNYKNRMINAGFALLFAASLATGMGPLVQKAFADSTPPTTTYSYDFTDFGGTPTASPVSWSDWEFWGVDAYTSDDASSVGPSGANALEFDTNSSTAHLDIPLKSGQTAESISFWAKTNEYRGNFDGNIGVYELDAAGNQIAHKIYSASDLSTTGSVKTLQLDSRTTSLSLINAKVVGNIAVDDVDVTVDNPTNTAPVASDASFSTNANTPLTDQLQASDSNGDSLTYTEVAAPAHGNIVITPSGGFTYTPNTGYTGTDSFTFKVNDGSVDSNTATVNLTVNSVSSVINISDSTELENAIKNQADGQTWNIAAGNYAVTQNHTITAGNQTGWYFPITASNITIHGAGADQTTIYGSGFTANGNWDTQDLIAIFGDDVTLDGMTLMPKVEPNKTIEVMGDDSTIENVVLAPNSLVDQSEYASISDSTWAQNAKQWGGSIYYNDAGGTHTLSNVTINNGGVSVHSPSATINTTNLKFDYASNIDWLNDYRFYVATPSAVINGTPSYTYHVNNALDNFDSVLSGLGDPSTVAGPEIIELDSDMSTGHQLTIKHPVTFEGNHHTITGTFDKTNNSNNTVLSFEGLGSGHTQVNELTVDGGNHNVHGIQVYDSSALTTLWRVTVENNGRSGVNVNDSNVQVVDMTTKNNGWHGIDVDKGDAKLQVAGINHFYEGKYTAGPANGVNKPDIYVDSDHANPGQPWVSFQTGDKFVHFDNYLENGDRAYFLAPNVGVTAPTGTTNANSVTVKGWANADDLGYYACYITTNQPITAFGKHWSTDQEPKDGLNNQSSLADNACVTTWTSGVGNSSNPAVLGHFDVSGLPDGSYTIHVHAHDAYHAVSNEATTTFSIDRTAPAAPSITAPGTRTWHKTSPILDSWTAVTDPSGVSYQIAYQYDDFHPFGGSTCPGVTFNGHWAGCRDVNGTSRNHQPGLNEEGGVTIWVRAIDGADNVGPWSRSVHYYYDHSDPETNIAAPTGVVGNNFTISGDASDNLALNRVYVQLNKLSGGRYGGTTINLITHPFTKSTHWSKTYDANALGLTDGQYRAHVSVTDMAGNTSSAGWTDYFTVDTTAPDAPALVSPSDGTVTNGASITQSWSDSSADIDHYVYESCNDANCNSRRWGNGVNGEGIYPASQTSKTANNVGEATYWWRVKAIDNAGNESAWSAIWKITVDNTAPVLSNIKVTPNSSGTYTFSGTTDDPGSPLTVKLDNNVLTGVTLNGDVWNVTVPKPSSDHRHTVTVDSTDAAGNVAVQQSAGFSVQGASTNSSTKTDKKKTDDDNKPSGANFFAAAYTPVHNNALTKDAGAGDQTGSNDKDGSGHTKGDQSKLNVNNQNKEASTTSDFLGLGWWWLPILAALVVFLAVLFSRANTNKT